MAILTEEEREIDAYSALEIESGATAKDIQRAFRKKSLKCHPDRVGSLVIVAVNADLPAPRTRGCGHVPSDISCARDSA